MSEILLTGKKRIGKKVITMRAKSEVCVLPQFFNSITGIEINNRKLVTAQIKQWHLEQKAKLDALVSHIAAKEMEDCQGIGDSGWLKDVVKCYLHPDKAEKVEDKDRSFLGLALDFIHAKRGSEGYRRHFLVLVRCVVRYEGYMQAIKDKGYSFAPEKVTIADIEGLAEFIRTESGLAEKHPALFERLRARKLFDGDRGGSGKTEERGGNLLHTRMKHLRTMWRDWNEKGLVTNDPFKGWKNEQEHYGTPYYINIEERNAIAGAPMPTKHLETQRDIFIFQCLIGCRVSDLTKLTAGNIHDGILEYTPRKTRNEGESAAIARIPLHPKAVELIEKYKGVDGKGRLFPCISDQKYNEAIKEVFTHAGITRQVEVRNSLTGETDLRPINEVASSHMARRTFIGNAYQKVSDPNIIGKMSGHVEGSRAFARYRKIEDDTLRRVIEQL